MFYAIIVYPQIDSSKLDQFRKKHDPLESWIKPHVTLVFPFDFKGDRVELEKHIEKVLADWHPFEISLKGIEKAWDNFIFLTVSNGKDKFIKLHNELYSEILGEFLRKDLEYAPHLTIGLGNPKNVDQLVNEANKLGLEYSTKVNAVTLSSIDVDNKVITYEKTFELI